MIKTPKDYVKDYERKLKQAKINLADTNNEFWLNNVEYYTEKIKTLKNYINTHDIVDVEEQYHMSNIDNRKENLQRQEEYRYLSSGY